MGIQITTLPRRKIYVTKKHKHFNVFGVDGNRDFRMALHNIHIFNF